MNMDCLRFGYELWSHDEESMSEIGS